MQFYEKNIAILCKKIMMFGLYFEGRGKMLNLNPIKQSLKPRIGLYSIGLSVYWKQFPGLKERLEEYGKFLEKEMSKFGEIYNYGLVDDEDVGRKAGEK